MEVRGGWRYEEEASYKEIEEVYGWNINITSNKWSSDEEDGGARRMEVYEEEEWMRRMEGEEVGEEDGGARSWIVINGARTRRSWTRRMEVRGGVDEKDGGARRRARRMEVRGGGVDEKDGWRCKEV